MPKIQVTLTDMDTSGLSFCCEALITLNVEAGHVEMQTVRLSMPYYIAGETRVLFYEGPDGRWNHDDANPRRTHFNTLTLTAVRKLDFVKAAIKAAQDRRAELGEAYKRDHSLYDARHEIYEYKRKLRLAKLLEEIKDDPTDKQGGISVAAARYAELECPERLDNPFAYVARERGL